MQYLCHVLRKSCFVLTYHHHNRFTALFPGPLGWAGARRELLDFMVHEEINRGRHTDHPAGRHSIRTNQCPPPPSPAYFYGQDALPAAQPTVSKHWRHNLINLMTTKDDKDNTAFYIRHAVNRLHLHDTILYNTSTCTRNHRWKIMKQN